MSAMTTSTTNYDSATTFLGEWGLFQRQVLYLLSLSTTPTGMIWLSMVFLADTPQHQCLIPAHYNLTAAWRNSTIPVEESQDGTLMPSQCSRYKLKDILSFSERGLIPGVDVNMSNLATEGCLDGWEYDRSIYSSTVSTEWDLVCDDSWKKPLTSSIYFFGVLFGSFVSGQLSDRYGRRVVFLASVVVPTLSNLIQAFSPSWSFFCCIFFIIGIGQSSKYIAAFVLGNEILCPRIRKIYSTISINFAFTLGYMMLPLLAFIATDWRMLLLSFLLPCIVYVPLWWYIPESPRWLISKGRIEEAEAIIRNAAKKNNIDPPSVIFAPLQIELQSEQKKTENICDLFHSQNILWTSVVLWLVWITVTINYFALSLNTVNLHGNPYLNCFLSALVELPAYILSWILFRGFSRRLSMFSTLTTGGLLLLLIQLVPADLVYLAITLEMLGKFAVATAFSTIYGYSAEVYPTVLRNTALGTCSMVSRIGSIIAPYFIYLRSYSVSLPYILIGCITVLSGLLSLLLPETHGMPLPETINQMQPFGGCFQKTSYTLTHTEENKNAAEKESPVILLESNN